MLNMKQFVLLIPLLVLSGCFKVTMESAVDKKGNLDTYGQIETTILFADNFNDFLAKKRKAGIPVKVQSDPNGNVRILWHPPGVYFGNYQCTGFFSKTCTFHHHEFIDSSSISEMALYDAILRESKGKVGSAATKPTLTVSFSFPAGTNVKSSDHDRIEKNGSNIYLYWERSVYPGSIIDINFEVKLP